MNAFGHPMAQQKLMAWLRSIKYTCHNTFGINLPQNPCQRWKKKRHMIVRCQATGATLFRFTFQKISDIDLHKKYFRPTYIIHKARKKHFRKYFPKQKLGQKKCVFRKMLQISLFSKKHNVTKKTFRLFE